MESFVVLVQYACSISAISVPPNVMKCCRKEHKKMQVKKESQQIQSRWRIWYRDVVKSPTVLATTVSENLGNTKSESQKYFWARWISINQERGDLWCCLAHQTTQNGTLTTSGLLQWKSDEMLWTSTGETRRWQICHRWWYGLWHRHRIEPFFEITIILEQGEWSIAKDAEPCSRKCNARHRQTSYDLGECSCLQHWKHLVSCKRKTQKIYIPSKIQEKSLFKDDVRNIWTVDVWTIGWFLDCQISLDSFPWKQLPLSFACKGLHILRFCLVRWKDEWESTIKCWLGTAVAMVQIIHHNTEHLKQSTEIRLCSSVIFPQDSQHWSLSAKSKSSWAISANPDQFQGRIIFRSMFINIICWNNCEFHTFVSIRKKIFNRTFVIPRTWIRKVYFTPDYSPRGEWDLVAELLMVKFGENGHPVFRATSPLSRGTLRSNAGAQFLTHFCAVRLKFFRTIISVIQPSIYGAIPPIFRANWFNGNDTHIFGWDSCTRKSFAEALRKRGKLLTTRSIEKFVLMQDSF